MLGTGNRMQVVMQVPPAKRVPVRMQARQSMRSHIRPSWNITRRRFLRRLSAIDRTPVRVSIS